MFVCVYHLSVYINNSLFPSLYVYLCVYLSISRYNNIELNLAFKISQRPEPTKMSHHVEESLEFWMHFRAEKRLRWRSGNRVKRLGPRARTRRRDTESEKNASHRVFCLLDISFYKIESASHLLKSNLRWNDRKISQPSHSSSSNNLSLASRSQKSIFPVLLPSPFCKRIFSWNERLLFLLKLTASSDKSKLRISFSLG